MLKRNMHNLLFGLARRSPNPQVEAFGIRVTSLVADGVLLRYTSTFVDPSADSRFWISAHSVQTDGN